MESSLTKYFDKVYCINYIECKDRRESIINQFKNLEMEVPEFIYGIPFSKINSIFPFLDKLAEKSTIIYKPTIAHISCAMAHYMAVKQAYELGLNSVLIIEDDIILRNNKELIFNYLDEIPNDWDYLYFTPQFLRTLVNIVDLEYIRFNPNKWINLKEFQTGYLHEIQFIEYNRWISSGAYAMNRKAMQLYITMFENLPIMQASDDIEYFYSNIQQSPLNAYTTKERLFATNNEINSIKFQNGNYLLYADIVSNTLDVTSENFIENNTITKSIISKNN